MCDNETRPAHLRALCSVTLATCPYLTATHALLSRSRVRVRSPCIRHFSRPSGLSGPLLRERTACWKGCERMLIELQEGARLLQRAFALLLFDSRID
jgi:hypothetical protein